LSSAVTTAAKETVAGLIRDIGLEPVDVGGLDQAANVEAFARMNVNLGFGQGWASSFIATTLLDVRSWWGRLGGPLLRETAIIRNIRVGSVRLFLVPQYQLFRDRDVPDPRGLVFAAAS